ncbi:MAG: hypothetical protein HY286_14705 [Planctomycetes bacterium]|nr:hypothetical protein [Planctomycetota bacterium]
MNAGAVRAMGIAFVASLAFASCTSDRSSSLRSMAHWAETDTQTFIEDIKSAPSWFSSNIRRDSNEFYQTAKYAVVTTAQDAKISGHNISNTPAFFAKEVTDDFNGIGSTVGGAAIWTKADFKAAGNDITGAPGFFADETKNGVREVGAFAGMVYKKAADDSKKFPERIWEVIQMLFIK